MSDHLDDLPSRTDEHVGEDDSRRAFEQLFRDPYFLLRGADRNDYGVDLTVEALSAAGAPTNYVAQAQLKASTKDENKDGSYSYAVSRTNLNYLLNHPGSFYAFYARESGEVYYRSAEDEYRDREAAGTAWRSQKTLTIRFTETLNAAAVAGLRDQIIAINRYLKTFRLGISVQAVSLESKVVFDPATGDIKDLTKLESLLTSKGLGMVAAGYAGQVAGVLAHLPEAGRSGPVWLVAAYVAYSEGRVLDATVAADTALHMGVGDDDKAALATYVSATARFAQGVLSQDELRQALRELEERYPNSVSALYSRMDRLRRQGVGGDRAVVEQLEDLAKDIRGRGPSFEPMAIQADALHLESRYFVLNKTYSGLVMQFKVTEALGVDGIFLPERVEAAQAVVEEMRGIFQGFQDVLDRAVKLGDNRLVAETLLIFETCKFQDQMTLAKVTPDDPQFRDRENKLTDGSLARLEHAATLFQGAAMPDGSLRCRLLQVDLLWLAGRREEARGLATGVAKAARSLGQSELADRAAAVANGGSPMAEWDRIPNLYS